jgi:hypothetical protein
MSRFDNTKSPQVTATIDLHGYRKSEGISVLTSFLDQVTRRNKGDVWVTVVTGTGAHSSDGPILRTAVQALLEKRKMVHTVNRGKGSFTVKANSGFVLYAPEAPKDTKVVLQEATAAFPPLPKSYLISRTTISRINPLPSEVAASDANVEDSRKERQKVMKENKKDEKLLKRVLSESFLEAKTEKEEDEKIMKCALSLSLSMIDHVSEDDEFLKALELSQLEFENLESADDLQRAIALSQNFSCQEDKELLRILEQSKRETMKNKQDFSEETRSISLLIEKKEEELARNVATMNIR